MKLEQLLQTPLFHHSRVIAGHQGLSRNIESVNMMDAPDIIDYLKPDELLLTTGYAIRDDLDALQRLVRNMAEQGCAGLAIKTKRFLNEVPRSVLDIANQLQFPIIELPLDHGLGELIYESLNLIQEHNTKQLSYALETHRHFSNLIIKGKGLTEIIHSLAGLIAKPVLLIDAYFHGKVQSSHFQSEMYTTLPDQLCAIAADVPHSPQSEPTYLCLRSEGAPPHEIILFPIRTSRHQGYLAVFTPWIESSSLTMLAIEQAISIIALETIKLQELKKKSRQYKNVFLSEFLEGHILSESEVMSRGSRYGLVPGRTYYVVIGKIDPAQRLSDMKVQLEQDDSTWNLAERIYYVMKDALSKSQGSLVIYNKDNLYHLIVVSKEFIPIQESVLLDELLFVQRKIRNELATSVSFGISSRTNALMDIPRAFKDALDSLSIGYMAKQKFFIQPFRTKQLIDLLRLIPHQDLSDFYTQSLQGILSMKDKEKEDLLETLATYLDFHCSIADTAKQMYLHRNTVIYRLDKCEQLIGARLKDADVSLRLRISLLMRTYIDTHRA